MSGERRGRGRPRRGLGRFQLMDYVGKVAQAFRVGPLYEARPPSAIARGNLISWTVDRWVSTTSPVVGEPPRDVDHVRQILLGKETCNETHLHHLSHVLDMPEFGLDWRDIWFQSTPDGPRLRDLDAFSAKLDAASGAPRDPLRLIRDYADPKQPWIGISESLQPRPFAQHRRPLTQVRTMVLAAIDEMPAAPPDRATVLKPGAWAELQFLPAVDGHILLIEHRKATGRVRERLTLLNDFSQLGLPQNKIWPARQMVSSKAFELSRICTEYTLICINWPTSLDPEQWGVKPLFKGTGGGIKGEIDPQYLKNVGLAMARTVQSSDALRVQAGLQSLFIDEAAGSHDRK